MWGGGGCGLADGAAQESGISEMLEPGTGGRLKSATRAAAWGPVSGRPTELALR